MNSYYVYNSSGYAMRTPSLNAIGIGSPTASVTSYVPLGMASGSGGASQSQITQIINYLDSINESTSDIYTILDEIADTLSWSGVFPTVSYSSMSTSTFTGTLSNNVTYQISRSYTGSYPVLDMTDFEPPDDIYSDILYRHTYVYLVRLTNSNDYDVSVNGPIRLGNIQNVSSIRNISIDKFYSQTFTNPYLYFSSNVASIYFYQNIDTTALISGDNRIIIYVDVYSASSTAPILLDPVITANSFVAYSSDISEQSDSLVNSSNSIHTQEEQYFSQNSQAIADTGLSNYRFSTSQRNGISVVTDLFNRLWNASGTWTGVYIFSMSVTVAMTIIRYSARAIRSTSNTGKKNGKS